MQTKSLRRVSCLTTRIIWNLPPAVLEREKTHATNRLREAKCDLNPACNVLGVSRATDYWWRQRDQCHGARELTSKTSRPSARCRNVWCNGHTTGLPQSTPNISCKRSLREVVEQIPFPTYGIRLTLTRSKSITPGNHTGLATSMKRWVSENSSARCAPSACTP